MNTDSISKKLYYTLFIENIENEKCTEEEVILLVQIFESMAKKTFTTSECLTYYESSDFPKFKYINANGFSLTIEKKNKKYIGIFKNSDKNLKIFASLIYNIL
jgi:hypothetical protein